MAAPIEIVCPNCGEVSAYAEELAGTTQQCGYCGVHVDIPSESDDPMGLRLRDEEPQAGNAGDAAEGEQPADGAAVVLLCPFCDEHAEFEALAAGTTQPCPHCDEPLDVLGSLVTGTRDEGTLFFRCEWCKRLTRTDEQGATYGCECPHCSEANDPEHVARNRLTSGQAERMGLLREPDADGADPQD